MKKRLLTLMLVAFVLCTMAINTFALSDADGYPSFSDYAYHKKEYSQYPEWSQTVEQPYFLGKCPECNETVTYFNMPLSDSSQPSGCIVLGNYYTFDYRGFYDNYIKFIGYLSSIAHSNFVGDNRLYYNRRYCLYGQYSDGNYYFYLHYVLNDNFNVSCPYFINYFRSNSVNHTTNFIEQQVTATWSNNTNDLNQGNITYDLYVSKLRDYIYKNYISSPYQDTLIKPYIENSYYQGSLDGEKSGYTNGYKDGFDNGTIHGQDMSNWTFLDLMDGIFGSASKFIRPILDIGVMDITIRSFVGLLGVVYVGMIMLKVIRG